MVTGQRVTVADMSGSCYYGTTITVQGSGLDTIDGVAGITLYTAYQVGTFVSNGNGNWTYALSLPSPVGIGSPGPGSVLMLDSFYYPQWGAIQFPQYPPLPWVQSLNLSTTSETTVFTPDWTFTANPGQGIIRYDNQTSPSIAGTFTIHMQSLQDPSAFNINTDSHGPGLFNLAVMGFMPIILPSTLAVGIWISDQNGQYVELSLTTASGIPTLQVNEYTAVGATPTQVATLVLGAWAPNPIFLSIFRASATELAIANWNTIYFLYSADKQNWNIVYEMGLTSFLADASLDITGNASMGYGVSATADTVYGAFNLLDWTLTQQVGGSFPVPPLT
jgi:hypothetical protein